LRPPALTSRLLLLLLLLLLVTALPMHLPQLIPAIQHYHWVLKTCHSGAELDTALTCAQGFVDPDLR
jgi:alpha-glucan,water dikinase